MPVSSRLDEVLKILQTQIEMDNALKTAEPLLSVAATGVTGGLAVFSILFGDETLALLGLTSPENSVQATGLVQFSARRARARKARYLVLSNQRETILQVTPRRDDEQVEVLRHYSPVQMLSGSAEPLTPPERLALTNVSEKLVTDLLTLHRDGQLDLIEPDADYFVDRLTRAVAALKPSIKSALITQFGVAPQFAEDIITWATKQGIPADVRSPDFAEAVVRQAIYRLLGKIIFYQSLRRALPQLPEMDMNGLDTSQVMQRLDACFAEAHKIDYHAVFRDDVVDRLPFPSEASSELRDLVGVLNTRDFAHLPQDVVGAVFERLIPPEDRHALGQFFTPENLVDFIVAFCVRYADDVVMDPTCGTGTFLIRAYDRKRTALGLHDHSQQLNQLWGIDVAPFPAELATINLFRQQVGTPDNFPRVLNEDFFNVIPGEYYRFPPLKHDAVTDDPLTVDTSNMMTPIPQFDAIVGNFPYISADRLEQREKGYTAKMGRRLATEWFQEYPAGFTFASDSDKRQHRKVREQGLDVSAFLPKAEPVISTFADLYVSMFWHAAAFLKPGGRMGIVTSNAWLDVGYGHALQSFFLEHFKIIAILESRCEPWFEQAAVNTVVTILERCESQKARDAHPARFVKIKRPLAELMPWDLHLDGLRRWVGMDKLVQRITTVTKTSNDPSTPHTVEDDDFRIRTIKQSTLRAEVNNSEQTVKWGRYLRAPQIYFDLLKQTGDKLALLRDVAPPARGSLTGINEFYHLDGKRISELELEPEFLFPLLKSPGESSEILVDESNLNLKVFVCRLSKDELRSQGKLKALRYIEWGEKQVFASGTQAGMTWPNGAEVKNRKPGWYAIPLYRSRPAQLFFASAFGERHLHKFCTKPLIADKRLYFLSPVDNIDDELAGAVMNSSLTAFFTETAGRVSMGDGALELTVEDARDYLCVPDARKFDDPSRQAIRAAFQPLLQRSIGSVFDEIQLPDRQALDRAMLSAVGLDPDEWLPRLYAGLSELVRERMEMGKKRGQSGKARTQKAAGRVAEDVLNDLLPEGIQRFPDDFLTPAGRASQREIQLPEKPVQHRGIFFGKEELSDESGQKIMLNNIFEVRFVLFAQASGARIIHLPDKMVEITRSVNEYNRYLRDLRQRLYEAYFRRTLDQAAANRFVDETWRMFKLPIIQE
jgi:methylase of polypeptide subunit release factors